MAVSPLARQHAESPCVRRRPGCDGRGGEVPRGGRSVRERGAEAADQSQAEGWHAFQGRGQARVRAGARLFPVM